jgi:hypothetical protein
MFKYLFEILTNNSLLCIVCTYVCMEIYVRLHVCIVTGYRLHRHSIRTGTGGHATCV